MEIATAARMCAVSMKLFRKKSREREGKVFGAVGAVSAGGGIISSYNVCHTLCMSAVALLSVFGIVVANDIFMFLQVYAVPFWSIGIVLLGVTAILYYKMPCCISKKLLLFNAGLLTIGVPFVQTLWIAPIFWAIGSIITFGTIAWFMNDRFLNWRLV